VHQLVNKNFDKVLGLKEIHMLRTYFLFCTVGCFWEIWHVWFGLNIQYRLGSVWFGIRFV